MWFLAALCTAVCFGINNSLFKWSTTKLLSKVGIQFYFYLTAFCMILVYGWSQQSFHTSYLSILIGALIGILNANGNIQMAKAFECGPSSLTSVLIGMNAIIPVFAAFVFFPEVIRLTQWFGIISIVGASVVIQYQPSGQKQNVRGAWITRVTLSLLSIGIASFLIKVAAHYHIQFLDMTITLYGGGMLYLCVFMIKEGLRLKELKVGSIVAIFSLMGYACQLFALQVGPASIVFPLISLSCLVVVSVGIFIYKERLKPYQWIGMMFALIGLILVRIE